MGPIACEREGHAKACESKASLHTVSTAWHSLLDELMQWSDTLALAAAAPYVDGVTCSKQRVSEEGAIIPAQRTISP